MQWSQKQVQHFHCSDRHPCGSTAPCERQLDQSWQDQIRMAAVKLQQRDLTVSVVMEVLAVVCTADTPAGRLDVLLALAGAE